MIVPRNALLLDIEKRRTVRLLDQVSADQVGCDEVYDVMVVFDVDPHRQGWPEFIRHEEFAERLRPTNGGRPTLLLKPESQPSVNLDTLSLATKKVVKFRWAIVDQLRKHGPKLYVPESRSAIAREVAAQENGASRPTLWRYMRLYWRNGMSMQALVPEFWKCGAPGAERIAVDEVNGKVGAVRTRTPGRGVAMTPEHRDNVARTVGLRKYSNDEKMIPDIYHLMLGKFYREYVKYEPGSGETKDENRLVVTHPDHVPSLEQFRYHWLKHFDWQTRMQRKLGRKYEQLIQLLTTGTLTVRGPGSRYYIDSTVLDAYVVSALNPNVVVGRPTLYIVTDEFSRMIVGFHLGLEPPSWVAAMLAVWNCCLDKVALCARYGYKITEDTWPTGHIPAHLLGDRGEHISRVATRFSEGFGIDIENSRAYAGQAKGVVERDFGTIQSRFGKWLPGWVDKEAQRGEAEPAALSAAMTLEQMTRLVIGRILYHNTSKITGYEGTPELVRDEVAFIPVNLWHWGARTNRAAFSQFPPEHLIRYLWPETTLRVRKKALQFCRGFYLMGQAMVAAEWFRQNQIRSGSTFSGFYHPTQLGQMYVNPPDPRAGLIEVAVTRRSASFSIASHSELAAQAMRQARVDKHAVSDNLAFHVHLAEQGSRAVENAKRTRAAAHDPSLSKAERMRGLKENRLAENEHTTHKVMAEMAGADWGVISAVPTSPESNADRELREFLASQRAQSASQTVPADPSK